MRQVAVGKADLADHVAVRAGQQPPQDLLLDQRGEHRRIGGAVEQSQHPGHGVEQIGICHPGRHRRDARRVRGHWRRAGSQHERGDAAGCSTKPIANAAFRPVDLGAGDGEVGGDDQVMARAVLVHLVAEQ